MTDTARQVGAAALAADKNATHAAARHRKAPLIKAWAKLAQLADEPPLLTLSLGTAAVGLLLRRRDLTRAGVRAAAAHALAIQAKSLLKNGIDRARPKHALTTGDDRLEPGDSDDHALQSFPSGHTAGAVAVARAAAHEIEGAALPATLAAGVAVAAQPMAGNHYLSDLAVGAAIGWAAEALVGAAFDHWTWGRQDEVAQTSS